MFICERFVPKLKTMLLWDENQQEGRNNLGRCMPVSFDNIHVNVGKNIAVIMVTGILLIWGTLKTLPVLYVLGP